MQEIAARQTNRELKQLVRDASHALARLDTGRLEELARSCQALNRDLATLDIATLAPDERRELTAQAQEASADMAVFARVLEATRSNLKVMQRLRELRTGRLEYREALAATYSEMSKSGISGTESKHGND